MQWIPCSMIECSGFHEACPKASRLNAVDSMQRHWMQCNPAAWLNASQLNAVYSMQRDWMQCLPCSVKKRYTIECCEYYAAWLNAVDSMQHDWCSGFYTAWPKAYRLNAVDSMQRHWMQRIPCIVAQLIPIVCSGVHAARPNASRLNAVDYMQHGQKHPD